MHAPRRPPTRSAVAHRPALALNSSHSNRLGSLASAGAARRLALAAAAVAAAARRTATPPVAAAATMRRSASSSPSSSRGGGGGRAEEELAPASSPSWHSCDSESSGSAASAARSASPASTLPAAASSSPSSLSPTCSGATTASSPSSRSTSASPQRPSASPSPLPGLSPPAPASGSIAADAAATNASGLHDAYTPWLRSAVRPGRPRDPTASVNSVNSGSQQRPRQRSSSWLASPPSAGLLAPALCRLSLTPTAEVAAAAAGPASTATTPLLPQESELEAEAADGFSPEKQAAASLSPSPPRRRSSPFAASMVSVASTEELVEVTEEEEEEEEEDDDELVPMTIGRGLGGRPTGRPGGRRRQALLSEEEDDDDDDDDDDGDLRAHRPPSSAWSSSSGQENDEDDDDDESVTSSSGTTAAESDSTFGLPSSGGASSDGSDGDDASTSSSFEDDELATPDGTPGAKNKKKTDKGKGGKKDKDGATPTPAADAPGGLAFARRRERLARELYAEWNALVFDGRLPVNLPIVWNPRLRCTAGQVVDDRSQDALKTSHFVVVTSAARLSPSRNGGGGNNNARASPSSKPVSTSTIRSNERIPCRLELSPRVLDRESRLRDTLAHEMAHVAAWAIDRDFDGRAHGATFQRWSRLFERQVPGITITTRHSYGPAVPQCRWVCSNPQCARLYSRSKLSIDVRRHVCGACKGRLLYQGKFTADGSALLEAGPAAPPSSALKPKRPLNAFGLFVKESYASVKASAPRGARHADVMALLSARWRDGQGRHDGDGGGEGAC